MVVKLVEGWSYVMGVGPPVHPELDIMTKRQSLTSQADITIPFPRREVQDWWEQFWLKACRTRSLSEARVPRRRKVWGMGWGPSGPKRKKHLVQCEVGKRRGVIGRLPGSAARAQAGLQDKAPQLQAAATG